MSGRKAPFEGLILDFDGTAAPGTVLWLIGALHTVLNRWKPVPLAFVRRFVADVTAFPPHAAFVFLLEGLGLAAHADECWRAVFDLQTEKTNSIDAGLVDFLTSRDGFPVKVLSAAGAADPRFEPLRSWLPDEDFLAVAGNSKADPDTFVRVASSLGINPKRWLCLDDTPLVLWSAKSAGFATALRSTPVFPKRDFFGYEDYIDFVLPSFRRLKSVLGLRMISGD